TPTTSSRTSPARCVRSRRRSPRSPTNSPPKPWPDPIGVKSDDRRSTVVAGTGPGGGGPARRRHPAGADRSHGSPHSPSCLGHLDGWHAHRPEHRDARPAAADQFPGQGAAAVGRSHRRGVRPHPASHGEGVMIVLLTLLSCLAALALLGVVAVYLVRIIHALEGIGGTPTSYLAKIRFRLRRIQT